MKLSYFRNENLFVELICEIPIWIDLVWNQYLLLFAHPFFSNLILISNPNHISKFSLHKYLKINIHQISCCYNIFATATVPGLLQCPGCYVTSVAAQCHCYSTSASGLFSDYNFTSRLRFKWFLLGCDLDDESFVSATRTRYNSNIRAQYKINKSTTRATIIRLSKNKLLGR